MKLKLLLIALLCLPGANGQLKDYLKSAADKLKEASRKQAQNQKPTPPPAAPTAEQKVGTLNPSPSEETIWANIAVDEGIVKQQAEQLREDCMARKVRGGHSSLDCDCIVTRYPEFRLRQISKLIRQAERESSYACKRDPEGCAPYQARFQWITSREVQEAYPNLTTNPPRANGKSVFSPPRGFDRNYLAHVYLELPKVCVDHNALAAEAYKNCQEMTKTGMYASILKPGQSTQAFCSCVQEKVSAGSGESEAQVSCSK